MAWSIYLLSIGKILEKSPKADMFNDCIKVNIYCKSVNLQKQHCLFPITVFLKVLYEELAHAFDHFKLNLI